MAKKLALATILFLFLIPISSFASDNIKVFVDGTEISTDQPPLAVNGRTLVPLRSIFEALKAEVFYEESAKRITAVKAGTTINLVLNSNKATVNNKVITLDVPAGTVNDRTMVPVRFVSEALGEEVIYDAVKKEVQIESKLKPITNLQWKDISDYGDVRDIQVEFKIPISETRIKEYRVMIVPNREAAYFTAAKAEKVTNFVNIPNSGELNKIVLFNEEEKDVNGEAIDQDERYHIFVYSIAVEGESNKNVLSTPSSIVNLVDNFKASAVTNVKAKDISDFGDGRDIEVTFKRASDETKVSEYRVMVIKSAQADSFNLDIANSLVDNNNYTVVTKEEAKDSIVLSAQIRDVYGEIIREGVDYRVFVLSVSSGNNSKNNALSSESSVVKLSQNSAATVAATNVSVRNVGNAGNGSDMEVKFNKVRDEDLIEEYRVMVVKASKVSSFDLTAANRVSPSNYTSVEKTDANITQRLDMNARDVDGDLIGPRETYRVFVLTVSNAGNADRNALSQSSAQFSLSNPEVDVAIGINVLDVDNNGNGEDLEVSFINATNESSIAYYALMVLKEEEAWNFDLSSANVVTAANYTKVAKNSRDMKLTLNESTRDVNGDLLVENVPYKIFILSVADGKNAAVNTLSNPSNTITLTNKTLTWNGNFEESTSNDGTISTRVKANLTGDMFVQQLEAGVHYRVSNLPTGLSIHVIRNSNDIEFIISGKADYHEEEDSIDDLTITFTNAAFNGSSATGVSNSTNSNLKVKFID